MPRLAANLTMLFNELPFLERFEAAARAGFKHVEFLFPYAWPASQIRSELEKNGLELVLFNLAAGNWDAGERGLVCLPDRIAEFQNSVDEALGYAKALGCSKVHGLAGIRPQGAASDAVDQTFLNNVRYAARAFAGAGATLMLEPINTYDIPDFYLTSSRQALTAIDQLGEPNVELQYDVYHMHRMGEDVFAATEAHIKRIGHIQIADAPGRHEPGTGEIDFARLFDHLDHLGYRGAIGCEYRPLSSTTASLAWSKRYLSHMPGR